ncbi:ATPase [Trinickia dabaoshanensis]|uniref:ATPase n=1 Tax=Trinickia dabaoshanensis TaxID=564714 RepID=A0A2N7VWQ9_9BURK|nr:HAD-IC family P-type ATPase [Trinickia dabaoshanensis]PMS21563.1 ATPase [Trinickia dabaoshanensis]
MADLPDGLSLDEVAERRGRGAVNRVKRQTSRSFGAIVRANVFTRFNALLGTLCAVVLVVGPWQDALFGGVLITNSLIGIVQEWRAKRQLDRLALLHQPRARVRRAGQTIEVHPDDIVKDDLIAVERGDQIVVDGVVWAANGLEIDESLLTGESEPQTKTPESEVQSGSFVVAGQGWYRATRVGQQAWAHQLAAQVRRFVPPHSELNAGINRILRYVCWAIMPLSTLMVATQLLRGASLDEALLFSAGGVAGMVPEGLVLLTSVALAIGAVRLAQRGTLMQELPAIETLARVDVICLDKTGTLTEGVPVMERLERLGANPDVDEALAALVLSDPAPNATLRAIAASCTARPEWHTVHAIPFSSARKWAGASFIWHGTWILGAPDVMLGDSASADDLRRTVSAYAREGRRVLLLARSGSAFAGDRLPDELAPVALVLLAERVRADAPTTAAYFAAQGVSLKVISGDHADTAAEVARRAGIEAAGDGVDARALPEGAGQLGELMERETVFGRVSPQQKEAMVAALRGRGHVVAMIGDGVNDLLALKEADIGIAMGSGSGAAASVAQAVLIDDRFASLPSIVNEGRRVIGNVERVANLFVTKTVYVMLLAFAVGVADLAFPFLPRHLTLVGSLTIGIPAFFLSLEPTAERARRGFVERVLRFTVPAGVLAAIATFAAYSVTLSYLHGTLDAARSAATVTLLGIALWIVALLVRPLTRLRIAIVAAMAVSFALVSSTAPLRAFFALEPLPLRIWLGAIGTIVLACSALRGITTRADVILDSAESPDPPSALSAARAWLALWRRHKVLVPVSALLFCGSAWLFLGVLEDVLSKDPLMQADLIVYRTLQNIRVPYLDSWMTGMSELGDAAVVVPVVLVVLSWFVWHRRWRAAIYWLAAVGGAEVIVKLLKLALHRTRPNPFASGVESFSFPSSHATLAVVTYGFLAFLLCEGQRHRLRTAIVLVTAVAVSLIAASRLYLGVHWVSDVVAGLSFGLAWVTVLAVGYSLQPIQPIGAKRLMGIVALTLLAGAALHMAKRHHADVALYRRLERTERMTATQWRGGAWRTLPVGRVAVVGRIDEPFSVQWAATARTIERVMQAQGWRAARSDPAWPAVPASGDERATPAIALKFHEGAAPAMAFVRIADEAHDTLLVLRLWPAADLVLRSPRHGTVPLWTGTVTRESPATAFAWSFSVPSINEDFTAPAAAFARPFADAQSVTRDDPASAAFRRWDGRVWLLCTAVLSDASGDRTRQYSPSGACG